jgi:plastocyanin
LVTKEGEGVCHVEEAENRTAGGDGHGTFVPASLGRSRDTAEPGAPQAPLRVEIAIRARQFEPSRVTLRKGETVLMTFINRDAELHAFVPMQFLESIPLHVDGNGAPQFSEKGLVRVLIPSGGRAEIQFVPELTGVYQYRCDLPGHQMLGEIVVK